MTGACSAAVLQQASSGEQFYVFFSSFLVLSIVFVFYWLLLLAEPLPVRNDLSKPSKISSEDQTGQSGENPEWGDFPAFNSVSSWLTTSQKTHPPNAPKAAAPRHPPINSKIFFMTLENGLLNTHPGSSSGFG